MKQKIKIIIGSSLLAICVFCISYFLFINIFENPLKTLDIEDHPEEPEEVEEPEEIEVDIEETEIIEQSEQELKVS